MILMKLSFVVKSNGSGLSSGSDLFKQLHRNIQMNFIVSLKLDFRV